MLSNNALDADVEIIETNEICEEEIYKKHEQLNILGKITKDITSIFEKEYEQDTEDTSGLINDIHKYITEFYNKYKSNKNYNLLVETAVGTIVNLGKTNGIDALSTKSVVRKEFKSASIIRLKNPNKEDDTQNTKKPLLRLFERLYTTKNELEHIMVAREYIANFILENQENANYNDLKELAISRIREVTVNRKISGLKESKIKSIFTEIENESRLLKIDAKPVVIDTPAKTKASITLNIDPLQCFSINKKRDIEVTTAGVEIISNALINELGLISGTKSIETFLINEGIWAVTSSNYLEKVINQILQVKTKNFLTNKQIQEVSKRMMMNSFSVDFGKNNFNVDPYRITFKNGTFDMRQNYFYPKFFKEDRSTVKVNRNYRGDLATKRPVVLDEFLSMMLDEETIELVYQILGCLLIKRYTPKKFILLFGGGDNGKSTLMELFTSILGKENTASVDLKGLTDPNLKFQRVLLMDKLANLCGEIPPDYVFDTSLLKILTGNDFIVGEKKGQDPIEFVNFANIIFSCNKLPRFKDNSEGLQNRLLIIPMNKNFKYNVTNPEINKNNIHINDIINNEELVENIIAYSITKFIECDLGKNLIIPKSVKKALSEYLEEDTLTAFINENYTFTDNDKDKIACKDILAEFKKFQEEEEEAINTNFTAVGIGKAIEERFSSKTQYKASDNINKKKQRNVMIKIKVKDFKEVYATPEEIQEVFEK